MKETDINKTSDDFNNLINLKEFFSILWQEKSIIISVTVFLSIIGVIYSLLLPNIYESRAILVPVKSSSSLIGSLGNYSSFAGLAGISLPTSAGEDNSKKALKKITSLSFFENNILPNIFLPDLMAVSSWDSKTNIVKYDDSIFNSTTNTWIRDYSYPMQQIPSAQESFIVFNSSHLRLIEDKKSGFITLSIKHKSPYIAKQWVELVVNEVNNFYRQKDKVEAQKSSAYLNNQISMTSLSQIKEVLAELLQEETKKLSLIEAIEYYVFDFIDTPAVMEKKSEPQRAVICILSALLGGLLGILLAITRHYISYIKLNKNV